MNRDDWKGLGTSIALHALLLLMFAFIVDKPQTLPLGMLEVEFGPFEIGEPAPLAERTTPPTQTEPEPQPQPPSPPIADRQPEQVNLPERTNVPEPDQTPARSEDTQPAEQTSTTPPAPPASREGEQDSEGGNIRGQQDATGSGTRTGDADASRSPFNVEGLDNRTLLAYPLPTNPGEQATSVIALCVEPDGRVVNARPEIRTGRPGLDNNAIAAVQQWRFDRLPPAAPQERQCGRVTFRFTAN